MRVRGSVTTLVLLLVAVLVPAAPAAAARAAAPVTPLPDCTSGGPRPCLVSVTRDGAALPAGYALQALAYAIDGAQYVRVLAMRDGDYDLGAADLAATWSFTVDLGTTAPRVVTGKGTNVAVVRSHPAAGYLLTVTGRPVTVSGQCDQSVWPWTCEEWAVAPDPVDNREWTAYFDVEISDFGQWDDAAQREAAYGMNYFTNVAATGVPPSIMHDSVTGTDYLVIDIANRRYLQDGVTLVDGEVHLRIPYSFLQQAYGVENPAAMTSAGVTVGGSGTGTVAVTHDPAGGALLVDITGIHFPDLSAAPGRAHRAGTGSVKVIRVKRGVITPTRPAIRRTVRVSAHRGVVVRTDATSRGARIRTYVARCESGRDVVRGRDRDQRIAVTGLLAGRAYACRVRAVSTAGPGPWSAVRWLARRP